MNYNKVKIILTNYNSENNNKLLQFIESNLRNFNISGIVFEWAIAYPHEKKYYQDLNITKFPVIITNMNNQSQNISGVDNIINYLTQKYNSISKQKQNNLVNGDIDIKNCLMNIMGNPGDEDIDEDTQIKADFAKKTAEFKKEREVALSRTKGYNQSQKNGAGSGGGVPLIQPIRPLGGKNTQQDIPNAQPRNNNIESGMGGASGSEAFGSNNLVNLGNGNSRRSFDSPMNILENKAVMTQDDELSKMYWANTEETFM
jgi:hypothetical protein